MIEYQKKLSLKNPKKYKIGLFLVKIRSVSYIFQRVNEVRENKSCFASQINIYNFGFAMRLSTFKIAIIGLLKIIIVGASLLHIISAESKHLIQGLYDLDGDGLQESLVLNHGDFSVIWVEFSEKSHEVLWSYKLPNQQRFNDAEVIDLDGDVCEGAMGAIVGYDKNGKTIYATPDKVLKLGLNREKGFLYYVGKDGNIYRSKIQGND